MKYFKKTRRKRVEAWLIAAMFLFGSLTGCASVRDTHGNVGTPGDGKLKVVTTLFPYYDFDAPDLKVITMMDYVDVVQEEIVEGMEDSGDDHGHDHAHHDEEDDDHADHDHDTEDHDHADDDHAYEIEYDEHIWTSPVNAMKITQVIADTLEEMDPADAAVFRANEADYLGKLKNLDQEFRDVVDGADLDLIVMADKFPLRYFADTYGLRYRAAFSGCSSDTEPSAKTIAYLIDKVREEQIPAVYYLELSSHRVAEIISEETGAKPLLFHSCHNVTRREFESGVTYLQLMEQNVVNLREGLYR